MMICDFKIIPTETLFKLYIKTSKELNQFIDKDILSQQSRPQRIVDLKLQELQNISNCLNNRIESEILN